MNEIEDFKKKILKYDFVSFDIFDTLLYRTVNQAYDQLELIPYIYTQETGEKLKGFVKNRIKSEAIVRRENPNSDVTLEMIYAKMPYSEELCKKLQDIECNVELKICRPNSVMVGILNWCIRQGKHVVITTDMYLPRTTLQAMLKKIGITYERLFISSEEKATKNEGKLFEIVLQKLDIDPSRIIHIGDNPINDISKAQEYGIAALLRLENSLPSLDYAKTKSQKCCDQHIKCLIKRGLQDVDRITPEIRIGYSIVGPMLYEFCEWLHNQKNEKDLDLLLFVAREGYLIKLCYDLMYPDEVEQTKYIRLNKNLLRLPLLIGSNPVESFINGIIVCKSYTWKLIFSLLRVKNNDAVVREMLKSGLHISLEDSITREDLINGKYNEILKRLFLIQDKTIKEQEQLLCTYLKQKTIVGKKVGLVNNSFNGNGQYMVESFMTSHDIVPNIMGLQFYTRQKCINRLKERCVGFVTNAQMPLFVKELIAGCSLIMEHFMFEHNGTALFYQEKSDGNVDAVCEYPRHEQLDYHSIDILQKSVLQFIKDARESLLVPLKGWGFYSFYYLLRKPILEDAMFIGNLWDDDDDGDRHILNTGKSHQSYLSILKFERRNDWPIGDLVCQGTSLLKINVFYWKWIFSIYKRSKETLLKDLKYIINSI